MPVYIPPSRNVSSSSPSITGVYVDLTSDQSISGEKTWVSDQFFDGNITVAGSIVSDLNIEDNIIVLNKGETAAGVTLGYAGIQIDRGTATDATLRFKENALSVDNDNRWVIDIGDGTEEQIVYDNIPDDITLNGKLTVNNDLDVNFDLTLTSLTGNNGEIVTLDANGKLQNSGVTVASLSGDYVNITGDTMTGTLSVPTMSLGTSGSDAYLYYDSETVGNPAIRFKDSTQAWQLSNEGTFFSDIQIKGEAGALSKATVVSGGPGLIDVSSINVILYSDPSWEGSVSEYVVPAATGLLLTDNVVNYLNVRYNAGSPEYYITTDDAEITDSDVVVVSRLYRHGNDIHHLENSWGLSTPSRLNRRLVEEKRFVRTSGLSLSESTGRVIEIGSGTIWWGIEQFEEPSASSTGNNAEFWYHSAGVWTHTSVSTYNNTQYDNGTNLVTMGANKYTINWVFRFVNGDGLEQIAYVVGNAGYNSSAAAAAAPEPTLPPLIDSNAILVGRIVVQYNASTASLIDSAFDTVYVGAVVTSHNNLSDLQGGTVGQYYHLTSAEYSDLASNADVVAISGSLGDYVLKSGDTMTGDLTITPLNVTTDGIVTVDSNGTLQNSGLTIADISGGSTVISNVSITSSQSVSTAQIYHIEPSTEDITLTIPDASVGNANQQYRFVLEGAVGYKAIIKTTNDQPINGSTTQEIKQQNKGFTIVSHNGTWDIIQDSRFSRIFVFPAEAMDTPNSADWAVNSFAPAANDSVNSALVVRQFDDSTEEGIGIDFEIPDNTSQVRFEFWSRSESLNAGDVAINIYDRTMSDNATLSTWSSAVTAGPLVMTADNNWHKDEFVFSTTTLALSANQHAFFEIARDTDNSSDTLSGDWTLFKIVAEIS